MSDHFPTLFLIALLAVTAFQAYLLIRQGRHVRQHADQVPTAFSNQISLDEHQKAARYTLAKARLSLVSMVPDLLLTLALTLGGGLASLFHFWENHFSPDQVFTLTLALAASLWLISTLIGLPLAWYRQFVLEEKFGFNRMTQRLFWSDQIKHMLLGAIVGIPLLYAALWLLTRAGENWWLYVWAVWCGFNLLMLYVYPAWIAPFFNRFSPLEEGEVKQRIDALLSRCGFACEGLFVMDGSRRSGHGNAYFTGFGRHRRIVFFDTLLAQLSPAEVEAVLAHELGHYHHRHIAQRIVLVFALSLAFLWLLAQCLTAPWFFQAFGIDTPHPAAGLMLFSLVVPAFSFPLGPLMNLLSRRNEFEADRFAVRQTSAAPLIQALIGLYRENAATLTPDPLYSAIHDSHPPATLRIAQLMQAKA